MKQYESNFNISGKLKFNIEQNSIKSIEFVSEYGTQCIDLKNILNDDLFNNAFKCVSNDGSTLFQ
jgi:hypothetical protein